MLGPLHRISSLRYKLLGLVLIPLLLLTGTVIFLAAQWSTAYTYKQLFTKVNTDLRVAHDIFQRIQLDRQRELESLGDSSALRDLLTLHDVPALMNLLTTERELGGFDFLNLLSPDGRQRLQHSGWQKWQLRRSALSDKVREGLYQAGDKDTASGIEIYSRAEWQAEDGVPDSKVILALIETPRAAPTNRSHEDRAMVIRVLHRVRDTSGRPKALLEGGLLLNNNFSLVDKIRDLVYGPGSLAAGSRGTVTVFLDDVRITTNVPTVQDTRALGTRVSTEVRQAVLGQGVPWIDRAFVVNDWYISAYQPIVDVANKRIGMLYAGYLEAPFRRDLYRAIGFVSALVLAGSLLAVVAAIMGAKSIFKPIETIASVARATSAGERRRIGKITSADEVGELALLFDNMLDSLEQQRTHIERDAQHLEEKVQLRTAELEHNNRSLQESINLLHETRQQLAMAEKLAALGELTAGVAHEINNPTAVILGNMDILIEEIGDKRPLVETEIDLIIEQVYRIRSITDRLLQYSRTSASAPQLFQRLADDDPSQLTTESDTTSTDTLDPNEIVCESLLLVRQEIALNRVVVEENFGTVDAVAIDRQELQQVLVNLIMNALQAVETGGNVSVSTRQTANATVCISVCDDGVGIPAANLQRLFDPFFTSGKDQGTGLGLSVSYGIVSRYGGRIEVESTPGQGARFSVYLPAISAQSYPAKVYPIDSVSTVIITEDDLPISMV